MGWATSDVMWWMPTEANKTTDLKGFPIFNASKVRRKLQSVFWVRKPSSQFPRVRFFITITMEKDYLKPAWEIATTKSFLPPPLPSPPHGRCMEWSSASRPIGPVVPQKQASPNPDTWILRPRHGFLSSKSIESGSPGFSTSGKCPQKRERIGRVHTRQVKSQPFIDLKSTFIRQFPWRDFKLRKVYHPFYYMKSR